MQDTECSSHDIVELATNRRQNVRFWSNSCARLSKQQNKTVILTIESYSHRSLTAEVASVGFCPLAAS